MHVHDTIDSLEGRLQVLQNTTGDVGESDLSQSFLTLSRELYRLFYEGREYSDRLMKLLECFGANEPCEDIATKSRTILSCYDTMMKTSKDLVLLDDAIEEFFKFYGRRLQPLEIVKLRELPKLVEKCNSLLVGSIVLAKRFMEMNLRFDEFWEGVDSRLGSWEKSA